MPEPRNGTYVWITWLSKVMAGEQNCIWASWFKSHFKEYEKVPSDFDRVKWTMEHTRRVHQLHAERESAGEQAFLEGDNEIRYEWQGGLLVAGKPDLVTISAQGTTVYDVKTGKARMSDQVQVMLYMYLLPLGSQRYSGAKPSGCVVYGDRRVQLPTGVIDDAFIKNFNHFLGVIGSNRPAVKVPSTYECRFCEIAKSECPERIEQASRIR